MFYVPDYGAAVLCLIGTVFGYVGGAALIAGCLLVAMGWVRRTSRLFDGLTMGGSAGLVLAGVLNEAYWTLALMIAGMWTGFMLARLGNRRRQ